MRYTGRMSWATRRKALFISAFCVLCAIPLSWGAFKLLYKPATCFDGIQNQSETSPDHGGPCPLLDENRLFPYSFQWMRTFSVREGVASAVAYIENPNQHAGVVAAPYRARFYDAQNVLVADETGETTIIPGTITPVYIGDVNVGYRTPTRVFVELLPPLIWQTLDNAARPIRVYDILAGETGSGGTKITARATNDSADTLQSIRFVVVVFDGAGNAFAASQTLIPRMEGGETVTLTFTWSEAFTKRPARIDVMPMIVPQN